MRLCNDRRRHANLEVVGDDEAFLNAFCLVSSPRHAEMTATLGLESCRGKGLDQFVDILVEV